MHKIKHILYWYFLKIDDYEGDSHKLRIIWYLGKYSSSFALFHVRQISRALKPVCKKQNIASVYLLGVKE